MISLPWQPKIMRFSSYDNLIPNFCVKTSNFMIGYRKYECQSKKLTLKLFSSSLSPSYRFSFSSESVIIWSLKKYFSSLWARMISAFWERTYFEEGFFWRPFAAPKCLAMLHEISRSFSKKMIQNSLTRVHSRRSGTFLVIRCSCRQDRLLGSVKVHY